MVNVTALLSAIAGAVAAIISAYALMVSSNTLTLSYRQDSINNKRFLEAEKESRITQEQNSRELKRIHDRDSTQSYRDSVRTSLLIKEYIETRQKDQKQLDLFSTQIKLLNESLRAQTRSVETQNQSLLAQNEQLKIQNRANDINFKNLETNVLSNSADLSISPIPQEEGVMGNNILFSPICEITNIGRAEAIGITATYLLFSIDTKTKITYCETNELLAERSSKVLNSSNRTILRPLYDTAFPIMEDSSTYKWRRFVNIIIIKVAYTDKFHRDDLPTEKYLIQRIIHDYQPGKSKVRLRYHPTLAGDGSYLFTRNPNGSLSFKCTDRIQLNPFVVQKEMEKTAKEDTNIIFDN